MEAKSLPQYVRMAHAGSAEFLPAVTIAIAKRKGTNAVIVADNVLQRIEPLKGSVIPSDVQVDITRDYGETAAEKSNELLFHMLIAVVSVSILIAITLGFRESLIVFIAIPVTLALTLTVFYLYGYTLNRITLFALIFSIGILVDDAIVVVENIVRHWRMPANRERPPYEVAIEAVDEVGNPTILATLTVVAAILPMAFVGGLMGPYMRPIPIGASAAMVFSLLVAFIVTPWAAVRILKSGHSSTARGKRRPRDAGLSRRHGKDPARSGGALELSAGRGGPAARLRLLVLFPIRKSENAAVRQQERIPGDCRYAERNDPRRDGPRHQRSGARHSRSAAGGESSDLRRRRIAIQLQRAGAALLPPPGVERCRHSGEPAAERRPQAAKPRNRQSRFGSGCLPVAEQYGARIKVAEVPPGPPVLETLVAEVYGPDLDERTAIARRIRDLWKRTNGVVDVDWYVEDDQPKYQLDGGQREGRVERNFRRRHCPNHGAGFFRIPGGTAPRRIPQRKTCRWCCASTAPRRSDLEKIQNLKVAGRTGRLVALSELVHSQEVVADKSIYHKNLMPVTYVTGDVAGAMESPVYAILKLGPEMDKFRAPGGYAIEQHMATLPTDAEHYSMKWDGEWHITYEVFRDLGIAFAAVLILIYGLVVGWFQSFVTPLVIMAAIPFSLVGILPAHGLMNAFFTATSMIGFIAGAGIVVRNSIILVDFIELRLREGMPLDEAVIDAGAVRFRPMMLTAAAVVVGASVILFDPIFQGLAIALMAGEVASLALSRMTVPIVYFVVNRRRRTA